MPADKAGQSSVRQRNLFLNFLAQSNSIPDPWLQESKENASPDGKPPSEK
jgi:hypothetical protein